MSYIKVEDVSRQFTKADGSVFQALDHVDLEIKQGEFICLLGPSGCGKSTLLNILAGFEGASAGTVTIDGQNVAKPSPKYVTIFQNYGLLPWRTVLKNVELGLEEQQLPADERACADRCVIGHIGRTDAKMLQCLYSTDQRMQPALGRGDHRFRHT